MRAFVVALAVGLGLFGGPPGMGRAAWADTAPPLPSLVARAEAWDRLHGDVRRNIRRYGADRVVVAVDFDNTTARVPTYVGSDAWYQEQLRSGKDRDVIHAELERIFAATPHVLIDALAPAYLKKWQDLGVRVVVLTARSPRFHGVTLQAAQRLNLDFRRTAPPSPWEGRTIALETRDRQTGLLRQGNVTYQNGMVHCGDTDKGTVLRRFLEASDLAPSAVVFADDRPHHLAEVQTAFQGSPIDLRLIHIDDGREPKAACAVQLVTAI